jgi:hypothetical protein
MKDLDSNTRIVIKRAVGVDGGWIENGVVIV